MLNQRQPQQQQQRPQRSGRGTGSRARSSWWLWPLAIGWTLAVGSMWPAGVAAYYDGAAADGGRCSTKLDASLQQMFRKISAGSGGRSAHFPPIELDDDDDDNANDERDSPFPLRPGHQRPHGRHLDDADAAATEAEAIGVADAAHDASDNLASGAALQQHLVRLQQQRRHHRHRPKPGDGGGFHGAYDPYDLHASAANQQRFESYRRRPGAAASAAAGSAAAGDEQAAAAAAAAADDERRSRPWPNARTHRIQVAELRVRVPPPPPLPPASEYRPSAASSDGTAGNWVRVDRCQFQPANRTLDTRLTFPDLTISGRVQLQPRLRAAARAAARAGSGYAGDPTAPEGGAGGGGGGCTMILRLRQAGIEFRTVPLRQPELAAAGQQQQQRSRRTAPSVRTDSYFAQPGFVSVFAHGCDALLADGAGGGGGGSGGAGGFGGSGGGGGYGTTGGDWPLRRRPTRQRWPQNVNGRTDRQDRTADFADNRVEADAEVREDLESEAYLDDGYMNYGRGDDFMRFTGDILGYAGGSGGAGSGFSEQRTWPGYFGHQQHQQQQHKWQNVELANSAEREEQRTRDLEGMFARGVRGLLTSYMQRALQPAIKETLMESLGYRLSYG